MNIRVWVFLDYLLSLANIMILSKSIILLVTYCFREYIYDNYTCYDE